MFRRLVLAAAAIIVLASSGLWIRARIAERCPDVGIPTPIGASVTARGPSRSAELAVGSTQYTIEPFVTADFGAYVRPFPVPESHAVGVGLTVRASEADAVRAWRTVCLTLVHGDRSESPPAATTGLLGANAGPPGSYYRSDGASGFPEWPPGDVVDVEIVFLVNGAPYLLRLPSVPIGSMG